MSLNESHAFIGAGFWEKGALGDRHLDYDLSKSAVKIFCYRIASMDASQSFYQLLQPLRSSVALVIFAGPVGGSTSLVVTAQPAVSAQAA